MSTTTTTLPAGVTTGTWTIEASHSSASFTVRHAGISKTRGTIAITDGAITIGEDLASSSVTATLDPATVDTRDANRDGHLKSADFFEVEAFPTWTFTSTAVEARGDEYVVVGDLTIHGVTKQVELEVEFNGAATDPFGNARLGFSAKTEFSRKDFGLTWNAALETGGVLVSDKVKVSLEIEAIKA
ncbi:YceI family protein [Actinotalea ferrariae]|uniref:YceI family protein n=1 Tax=Actinotalea ferrariae TaxID=1386098 RepID=UPI001C8C234C|nr:YceI family protein [Actinotalea ferrariae]MBX9244621.1 YceI family protein [Actinotalea ferrariae]